MQRLSRLYGVKDVKSGLQVPDLLLIGVEKIHAVREIVRLLF